MAKVICKKCLKEGEETQEWPFVHICLPERTIADLQSRDLKLRELVEKMIEASRVGDDLAFVSAAGQALALLETTNG